MILYSYSWSLIWEPEFSPNVKDMESAPAATHSCLFASTWKPSAFNRPLIGASWRWLCELTPTASTCYAINVPIVKQMALLCAPECFSLRGADQPTWVQDSATTHNDVNVLLLPAWSARPRWSFPPHQEWWEKALQHREWRWGKLQPNGLRK